MTANLRLVPFNLIDLVASLSVTSAEADNPVDYLQIYQSTWRWQSTSAVQQVLSGDFGDDYAVDSFAVVNHNFTEVGSIHIEVATDAGYSNLVVDETIDAHLPEYGLGEGWLGLSGLGGFDSSLSHQRINPHYFDVGTGRYFRITITDTGNPDGFLTAGRFILGSAWEPSNNADWGPGRIYNPTNEIVRGKAGVPRVTPGTKYKEIAIGFSYLDENEESALWRIIREYGMETGVLLSVFPEAGTTREDKYSVYGIMSKWNPSQIYEHDRYQTGFNIEQM